MCDGGKAVTARLNLLVSGGTASGKTTLLNGLCSLIPSDKRVITVEETPQLVLSNDHLCRLMLPPLGGERHGAANLRELLQIATRLSPDRLVIGELSGAEAFDALTAMSTGFEGTLTLMHGNNPREALSRLERLVLLAGTGLPARAIRELICTGLDLIVQINRLRTGTRRITHVTEVLGVEDDLITLQDLFLFEQEGKDAEGHILGRHKPTGQRPNCYERLCETGVGVSEDLFGAG